MNSVIATVVIALPLLAFLVAGVVELRCNARAAIKAVTLIPILLGILLYGLSVAPALFPSLDKLESASGRSETFYAAVISSSGAFVPYARRLSSILVALGGLMLVFIGIFFSKAIT